MAEASNARGANSGNGTSGNSASKSSKGHCGRFWWLYVLVILIIAVVVVVPCVILVAVPRMAQKKLDDATLTIDGISVTNVQTNSLNMAINSTITTDGSTHATIDGFEGTMYLADVNPPLAFAKINFPETTSDAHQTVNVSQEIQISDQNAFTTFNEHLIQRESVYVLVKGDTNIHVRGISRAYSATFSKTVPLKGLNGFKGLTVTNPHVSLAQSDNFNATAHIPNPSSLTLDVGNTTFQTYLNGSDIGTSYILNLVLHPGANEFFIWADINNTAVLSALTKRPTCERNGTLTFELSGKNVTSLGQPIPYFANALAASNVSVDIPIGQAIKSDIGISVGCMD
ncbi:uncharacterized protein GGS22DRAFT_151062 [Annulohypoxylon maeteangense]|uniref:uncharacterized protein n=1 Tax=Annulohypoxylon maeteangense TaxID=1927788 RepID=UPI002007EAEC|nr:uncharacterized protein GGS22DRAFT_151062 [Annulohypoxylon maeteangense]KAI0890505.1 hypothetical protein GGS22DRAFT_151062 [Annulohypoxylon maeteangense]